MRPNTRYALRFGVTKLYNDGQITCQWHQGSRVCGHIATVVQVFNLSLTDLMDLYLTMFRNRAALNTNAIMKPTSTRRIPVPPSMRYIHIYMFLSRIHDLTLQIYLIILNK